MIQSLIPIFGTVLDRILPDQESANEAKIRLLELSQSGSLKELDKAGDIIKAEADSEHWLVSSWRPLTMLSFVAIIVNNYILAPYVLLFFSIDVTLELPTDLWDLLKIGLGGYVVGRSVEKTVKEFKK